MRVSDLKQFLPKCKAIFARESVGEGRHLHREMVSLRHHSSYKLANYFDGKETICWWLTIFYN